MHLDKGPSALGPNNHSPESVEIFEFLISCAFSACIKHTLFNRICKKKHSSADWILNPTMSKRGNRDAQDLI